MILVIGYGNPLRGDDGVGQLLVRHLHERSRLSDVAYRSVYQLTPELAEPISRARVVIFIDAHAGSPTGLLSCREAQPLETATAGAFTHNVSPETLLTAARELYHGTPKGLVVTIEGESFDYGEDVSPAMQAALPALLDDLEQLIQMECVLAETDA